MPKKAGRRRRLVPETGFECFEIRIVQWMDSDGAQITSAEVTTPDGEDSATLNEVMGALSAGKEIVRGLWKRFEDQ